MNTTKLMAACLVLSLVGVPTMSFAKARGGSGGGFSSGSRGSSSSGSMGSRGSRTYQDNGAKPIEQSTTARQATSPPPSVASGPSSTARPAPAAQPSWIQRNPLLAGIAGGLAGSWIGHMLFGATDSSARMNEAGEQIGEGGQAAGAGSNGMLLLLMVMGAGALWWYMRSRRTPAPDFTGLRRSSAVSGSLLAESSSAGLGSAAVEEEVTSADKASFQQSLTDIQTAWGKQDLSALRGLVTPEMLEYFSNGLAEQASEGVINRVEDVVLGRAEVKESWSEGATRYATVSLSWSARDYTVSAAKQPDEPGYVVEGSEAQPIETTEVWTFMRFGRGKWLLSAIQQVA
ncbi:MAG: TIM44-like domain-containing protein [Nitrospira sp.]|nr:TIM44-like domain-containing protein [Nitrospira sp.]